MPVKLTLTIKEEVIVSAKKYAQTRGKSLSNLVENYLKSVSTEKTEPKNLSSKVTRLMGVIKLPKNFNYKESLSKAITKKYK